jgi:hypothetical protein
VSCKSRVVAHPNLVLISLASELDIDTVRAFAAKLPTVALTCRGPVGAARSG